MKQFIVCVLMLVLTVVYAADVSEEFVIKHRYSGKFVKGRWYEHEKRSKDYIYLHSWASIFTFERQLDHWGYIKNKETGLYIYPDGGSVNPSAGTYLLYWWDKHWGGLWAIDSVNGHVIHKGGKYMTPKSGESYPSNYEHLVIGSGTHDGMTFQFMSHVSPYGDVNVYGKPTMAGRWKMINSVVNPIAEHWSTFTVKIGFSKTESRTSSFTYSWEVSVGVNVKWFSASMTQSFQAMVETASSSTWSEETTKTRQIRVYPGKTVVTWQHVFDVEQNLSLRVYQSNLLADTDSLTKVPDVAGVMM